MGHRLPKITTQILNPTGGYLLPQEDKQQSTSHFATEDPLELDITATEVSIDGFIDGIVTITVDYKHWIYCARSAALLVIHTLFRPLHPSESLKQYDPISLRKLAGEWGGGYNYPSTKHAQCGTYTLTLWEYSYQKRNKQPGPLT